MISVDGLTFAYGSTPPAVHDLSFSIPAGEIFGFLGPSGAGKSTTQKILMRLLKGYRGRVTVMKRPLDEWREDYFEKIGVCFELPSNYRKLSALENLQFFSQFFSGPTVAPQTLLDRVGLGGDAHKRVEKFSKGMQIRLNLARALLNQPAILFLDEPTAGLDPANARNVRDIILEQRNRGATVFLTTHDMTVANELCDRVGFLVDGRLAAVGAPEALRLQHGRRALSVRYTADGASQVEEFPLDGLGENQPFQELIRTRHIETLHTQEPSLENVFIKVTGKGLA
ncbi:MAG: ABC transporter ATP-binding protein [Phycisphaerales bacterium]|nr:ABC transporter ATP-binding protein [Hyphomonadaceae bacterium]